MVTGDIYQCMAQGPNVDSVRRLAQGMAGNRSAAPGLSTTSDTKGELSLNRLAEALQWLGVENALFQILTPHHILQPDELDFFFNKAVPCLVQDGYLTDIPEDRDEFLDSNAAGDHLRFVKHRGLAAYLRHQDQAGWPRCRIRGRRRREGGPARCC